MQTITIDKKSSPDVAAVAADLEPGTEVTVKTTVKANDDQTLTLTVREIEVEDMVEVEEEDEAEGDEGSPVIPD